MIGVDNAKLRLTVNYANTIGPTNGNNPPNILGHATFTFDELRNCMGDEHGVKRVSYCLLLLLIDANVYCR